MHLSDLQTKEIINMLDGKKLGKIVDVEIENNKIINLVIESKKSVFNLFKRNDDILLNFNNIEKIGEDVILVRKDYN